MEGSGEDGFIVFTLGSVVSQMPDERAKQFIDAFRQIPQRVRKRTWCFSPVPDFLRPKQHNYNNALYMP